MRLTGATAESAPDATPSSLRPAELEDGLNRLVFHPLARRLALRLAPTGISPNAVSIAGGTMVVAAGGLYVGLAWPLSAIAGFAVHALWHVVDGADGDLARLTGKASPTGELVDGLCDYVGHIILYVLLTILLAEQIGSAAWLIASLAGASRILQANHAESQRRTYLWWAYGRPWLRQEDKGAGGAFAQRHWAILLFGWLARLYLILARAMTPNTALIDAKIAAAANDPAETERIRLLVKRTAPPSILLQKALGSNPCTLLLGASMALGTPLPFFVAICLLLNLLLAVSLSYHRTWARALAASLEAGN
ncbi:MAG TPA: CDP-alcohol phosphatidyltransferase family protein [Allosphingosinicella sp.]|nr:CDP-alcohol phosphatidyltransferase family protein [Allosphingosinicella sp.]